jgi:hypothetical protein
MSPPELPADTPVMDVVHPVEVDFLVVIRDKDRPFFFHSPDGRFGERLDLDEPLARDQRLNDGVASLTAADVVGIAFALHQPSLSLQVGDDPLPGLVAVEPGVSARLGGHARILADDFHNGQ